MSGITSKEESMTEPKPPSRTKVAENIYSYLTRYGRHYLVQVGECRGAAMSLPEAKKLRAKYLEQGGKKPATKLTVAQAVAAWMKDGKVKGLAATTLEIRQRAMLAIVREHGKKPLESLTVGDYEQARDSTLEGTWSIERWTTPAGRVGTDGASTGTSRVRVSRRDNAPVRGSHSGGRTPLSPGTVRQYLGNWRAFEAWCLARKLIAENRALLVAKPKAPPPVAKALSLEALQAFLAACDGHLEEPDTPYAALLACVALAPLRMGEFRGMQWGDVDLHAGTLRLQRALSHTNVVKTAADGKLHPRTVPIGACLPYLQAQRAWQRQQGLPDVNPQGWVWSDELGKPLPYTSIRERADRWLAEAGLEHIRLHDFRHTGASRRLDAGVPIVDVQAMTGHRQVATLLRIYAHAEPVHVRAQEDRFAALVRTVASQREAV